AEKLHGRGTSTDHYGAFTAERLGAAVIHGVKLLADKRLTPGIVGDKRLRPRTRGIHDRASPPHRVVSPDSQNAPANVDTVIINSVIVDASNRYRTRHVDVVGIIIRGKVTRNEIAGRLIAGAVGNVHIRQTGHAVNAFHSQRRPAMLPRTARPGIGIQYNMVDAEAPQVKRRR